MARVRFHAPRSIDLDLSGSEDSIERRLLALASQLGPVDCSVLAEPEPEPVPEPEMAPAPRRAESARADVLEALDRFLAQHRAPAREGQVDAAVRVAYFFQVRAGLASLTRGDFVRGFLRARVDTKDVNETLDRLTADGVLVVAGEPGAYRLSEAGVASAERRLGPG